MTDVAVLGLGAMGSRIARRLVDAGYDVVVWNRDPEKAADFPRRAGSSSEAVLAADVVLTMVTDEAAVFDVLAATPLGAQAKRRRSALASGEYPPRFKLALAQKDARLVRDVGGVAAATQQWFERALRNGRGGEDYTAVLAEILGR